MIEILLLGTELLILCYCMYSLGYKSGSDHEIALIKACEEYAEELRKEYSAASQSALTKKQMRVTVDFYQALGAPRGSLVTIQDHQNPHCPVEVLNEDGHLILIWPSELEDV